MLSQKFEDERVDFNVIMSDSDEDLIRLGVRNIGDRVRLRESCMWVYTRSSSSISLGDTHRTSSNRPGREERALLFSPSVSSTGTGEARTGSRRRQSSANSYGISNINKKKKRRLYMDWAISVFVRLSCQKNTYTSGKTSVTESGFGT